VSFLYWFPDFSLVKGNYYLCFPDHEVVSELEQIVRLLHSSVMSEFSKGACSEVRSEEVKSCVKEVFEQLGFEVKDIRFFTLDGEETVSAENASYVRVEATHELSSHLEVTHIFTFALVKRRDKFKVVFLQSAIKVK